jgi:rhodanese-related sulfurtransferase
MFDRLFGGAASAVPSINVRDAWGRASSGGAALIDVREVYEYKRGHAKGAKNIPLSQLQQRVKEIPQDRDVLLICQSGNRSMQAARFLQQHGISRVSNVTGGTITWLSQKLPME